MEAGTICQQTSVPFEHGDRTFGELVSALEKDMVRDRYGFCIEVSRAERTVCCEAYCGAGGVNHGHDAVQWAEWADRRGSARLWFRPDEAQGRGKWGIGFCHDAGNTEKTANLRFFFSRDVVVALHLFCEDRSGVFIPTCNNDEGNEQ